MAVTTPRRCANIVALLLAAATLFVSGAAVADESDALAEARQALDELQYRKALRALRRAVESGENDPAAIRDVYRMLGEVQASLGKPKLAVGHFRSLLTLDPSADLAPGVSPKLREPFDEAKQAAPEAIAIRCRTDADSGEVRLDVDSDPLAMIAGARIAYRVDGGAVELLEARGDGSRTVRIPTTGEVALVCTAIDTHGNQLLSIGTWEEPLRLAPPAPAIAPGPSARDTPAPSTPVYARWYLWGAATVAAAGAGGYFAWQSQRDQDELDRINQDSANYSFSEALAVEDRAKQNALIANISFAVAGTFAAATLLSLVLAPDPPSGEAAGAASARRHGAAASQPRRTTLAPLSVPRGAGMSLIVSF
ncbi:MAG: hypothetical protein Tsb0020_03410 [Haliangiales bacterium]